MPPKRPLAASEQQQQQQQRVLFQNPTQVLTVLLNRAKEGAPLQDECELDRFCPRDNHLQIWKLHLACVSSPADISGSPVAQLTSLKEASLLAAEYHRFCKKPANTDDDKKRWITQNVRNASGRAHVIDEQRAAEAQKLKNRPSTANKETRILQQAVNLCYPYALVTCRTASSAHWKVLYPLVRLDGVVSLLRALCYRKAAAAGGRKPKDLAVPADELIRSALLASVESQGSSCSRAYVQLRSVPRPPVPFLHCGVPCVDALLLDCAVASKAVASLLGDGRFLPRLEKNSVQERGWHGLQKTWHDRRREASGLLHSYTTDQLREKVELFGLAFAVEEAFADGHLPCKEDFSAALERKQRQKKKKTQRKPPEDEDAEQDTGDYDNNNNEERPSDDEEEE